MKQRIITGLILSLLVVLGILYLPPLGFDLVAITVLAIAGWEFSGLFWSSKKTIRILFIIGLMVFFIIAEIFPAKPFLWVGIIWWLIVPVLLWLYCKLVKNYFTNMLEQWLIGYLIFVPCFVGLLELRYVFGVGYLLYVIAIICAADVGAYFAGVYFGKNLLAPNLSPAKTVEGLVGGIVAAILVGLVGGLFLHIHGLRWLLLLTLVIQTCLWSVIGDLFESMLKRQAHVKDSGNILPGHGGVYDRLDSLTAAVPIFAFGLIMFAG